MLTLSSYICSKQLTTTTKKCIRICKTNGEIEQISIFVERRMCNERCTNISSRRTAPNTRTQYTIHTHPNPLKQTTTTIKCAVHIRKSATNQQYIVWKGMHQSQANILYGISRCFISHLFAQCSHNTHGATTSKHRRIVQWMATAIVKKRPKANIYIREDRSQCTQSTKEKTALDLLL